MDAEQACDTTSACPEVVGYKETTHPFTCRPKKKTKLVPHGDWHDPQDNADAEDVGTAAAKAMGNRRQAYVSMVNPVTPQEPVW